MARPSAHGLDDGREVVVGEHQVGGLAGDVGSASAHGHADMRLPQRGGVVYPVARHGHDVPAALKARTMRSFCSAVVRAKTRSDMIRRASSASLMRGELVARDGDVALLPKANLLGDGGGGELVVSRDHHGADAGARAARNGVASRRRGEGPSFRQARGTSAPARPHRRAASPRRRRLLSGHVSLEADRTLANPAAEGEDPEGLARSSRSASAKIARMSCAVRSPRAVLGRDLHAARQEHVDASLNVRNRAPALVPGDHGHAICGRCRRGALGRSRSTAPAPRGGARPWRATREQRAFGWIANDLPTSRRRVLCDVRVVAERSGGEREREGGGKLGADGGAVLGRGTTPRGA